MLDGGGGVRDVDTADGCLNTTRCHGSFGESQGWFGVRTAFEGQHLDQRPSHSVASV